MTPCQPGEHTIVTAPASGSKYCRTCGVVNPPNVKPKPVPTIEAVERRVDSLVEQYFRWYALNSLWDYGEIRIPQ
jgi:hypothetical protein